MAKVKGMVAGKSVTKKKTVEHCRLNPAMRKIMEKRIAEEMKKKKQTSGLDVRDIQRQVDKMLNSEQ